MIIDPKYKETKYGADLKYNKIGLDILQNTNVSHLALRLFCIIDSCNVDPKNGRVFTPTVGLFCKQLGEKKTAVKDAIRNLKDYGYLTSIGKNVNTTWYIHRIPIQVLKDPQPKRKYVRKEKIDG